MDGKLHFVPFTQGIGYINQQCGISVQINCFGFLLKQNEIQYRTAAAQCAFVHAKQFKKQTNSKLNNFHILCLPAEI